MSTTKEFHYVKGIQNGTLLQFKIHLAENYQRLGWGRDKPLYAPNVKLDNYIDQSYSEYEELFLRDQESPILFKI